MCVERNKQFEEIEGLFTWYDEIMNNYEAAFWVHYHMLNKDIEIWIEAVRENNEIPRVTYFVNTEYMSMVFSELLITVETLFKAELARCGVDPRKSGHRLLSLMDKMKSMDNNRCKQISEKFETCRDIFEITDSYKSFINTRYLEYNETMLDDNSASMIKKIVIVLDEVYYGFYSDFNIERLLYLGMEASMGETEFSEDETRRLKHLELLD